MAGSYCVHMGMAVSIEVENERALTASGRAVAVVSVLILWWVVAALWFASISPPSTGRSSLLALVATAVASGATWWAARHRWWVISARQLWLPAAAASGAALLSAGFFFVPVGWGDLGIWAMEYFVLVPMMIVVGLMSLKRVGRAPGRSVIALGLVGVFFVVMRLADTPLHDAGLRFRILHASAVYQPEAVLLASQPPGSRPPGLDAGGHVVGRTDDGQVVVAWEWVQGIPGKSYGPAYDPTGVLTRESGTLRDGGYEWNGHSCQNIDGPWYWCRIY